MAAVGREYAFVELGADVWRDLLASDRSGVMNGHICLAGGKTAMADNPPVTKVNVNDRNGSV